MCFRCIKCLRSFDSLLGYDLSLLDQATDLPRLSPPLLPLPDDLLLLPTPVLRSTSPVCQSPRGPLASVVSSPRDLSREGPFYAYCVPSDTGSHPLISEGLPGCTYRITSYSEEDIADVEPAFGVHLHHPRFLKHIGAPELACLLGRSPAEWVRTMDRQDAMATALQLQWDAGLIASNLYGL